MDSQQDPPAQARKTVVIPGPKRLAFRIRKRGFSFTGSPSLLISNRFGVWSLGHRCYIRTTRLHRRCELHKDIRPVEALYHSLRRRGMSRWREYDGQAREEITFLKHRLMDLYWRVATGADRANIVRLHREEARDRRVERLVNLAALAAEYVICIGASL